MSKTVLWLVMLSLLANTLGDFVRSNKIQSLKTRIEKLEKANGFD